MPIADITPRQALDQLTRQLCLSDDELSVALGVTKRTLNRWRNAEAYPQHEARRRFEELLEFGDTLNDVFDTPEAGRSWMRTNHRYLGGLTPLEAIRAGRVDRARAALEALESGVWL